MPLESGGRKSCSRIRAQLKDVRVTHSALYKLSLPWASLSNLTLTIPDVGEATYSSSSLGLFDPPQLATVIGRCANIRVLGLYFDGRFYHLPLRDLPTTETVCSSELKFLETMNITSSSPFLTAHFLIVFDTPKLECFTLDTRHYSNDVVDILQKRFSIFIRSRRDTLRHLTLGSVFFTSGQQLLEGLRTCRELLFFTMNDNCSHLDHVFLEALTFRPVKRPRSDSKSEMLTLEHDCSNPFLEEITIRRYRTCRAGISREAYRTVLYASLTRMVRSRCNVPEDVFVEELGSPRGEVSPRRRASRLVTLGLGESDGYYMRSDFPNSWDIIMRCREEGLELRFNNIF